MLTTPGVQTVAEMIEDHNEDLTVRREKKKPASRRKPYQFQGLVTAFVEFSERQGNSRKEQLLQRLSGCKLSSEYQRALAGAETRDPEFEKALKEHGLGFASTRNSACVVMDLFVLLHYSVMPGDMYPQTDPRVLNKSREKELRSHFSKTISEADAWGKIKECLGQGFSVLTDGFGLKNARDTNHKAFDDAGLHLGAWTSISKISSALEHLVIRPILRDRPVPEPVVSIFEKHQVRVERHGRERGNSSASYFQSCPLLELVRTYEESVSSRAECM